MNGKRQVSAFGAIIFSIAIGGCAPMVEVPEGTIAKAKSAVDEAAANKAPVYSPANFELAQQKLVDAQDAVRNEHYVRARRLGEEAIVDAQLANAEAQAAQAPRIIRETQKTVTTIEQTVR